MLTSANSVSPAVIYLLYLQSQFVANLQILFDSVYMDGIFQGIEKVKAEGRVDCPAHGEGELSNAKEDYKFKV